MNILKNNFRLIIFAIILILVSSGIGVFAAYNYLASDIKYTNDKSVSDALNDLYLKYNDKENYDNKTYINTGLTIINDRIVLTDGGYYTDENGMTWVNISFKFNSTFNNGTWGQMYGLPNPNGKDFIITDTTGKMPFRINNMLGQSGRITYIGQEPDIYNNPTNTVITLQFKY